MTAVVIGNGFPTTTGGQTESKVLSLGSFSSSSFWLSSLQRVFGLGQTTLLMEAWSPAHSLVMGVKSAEGGGVNGTTAGGAMMTLSLGTGVP